MIDLHGDSHTFSTAAGQPLTLLCCIDDVSTLPFRCRSQDQDVKAHVQRIIDLVSF